MFYICHTVVICKFLMFEYRYPVIPLVKYCLDWLSYLFIHLRWLPRKNICKNNWRNCFSLSCTSLNIHWRVFLEYKQLKNACAYLCHCFFFLLFFRGKFNMNLLSIYCGYILFTLCTLYFIYDSEPGDQIIIALNLFQI